MLDASTAYFVLFGSIGDIAEVRGQCRENSEDTDDAGGGAEWVHV